MRDGQKLGCRLSIITSIYALTFCFLTGHFLKYENGTRFCTRFFYRWEMVAHKKRTAPR